MRRPSRTRTYHEHVQTLATPGAGLLLFSLYRLQATPPGLVPEQVVAASFTLPEYRYSDEARQASFFNQLDDRLQDVPGAIATAMTDTMPPGAAGRSVPFVALANPGGSVNDEGMEGSVQWRYVSRGYFETLGIQIKLGRGFSDADAHPGEASVVINEALARRLFSEQNPVGRRMGASTVVGVAADVRNAGLDRAADPEFYRVRQPSGAGIPGSSDFELPRRATALLRSNLPEQDAGQLLRAVIASIDPSIPVQVETVERQVDRFLTRPRFQTTLLSTFAATGLVLAAIGVYGLIAYVVEERRRELGVRVALGATPRDIVKLVVSGCVRWTAVGAGVGFAASVLVLRTFQSLLYQVEAADLRVLSAAIILLATVASVAWIPARRALAIDPAASLRHD